MIQRQMDKTFKTGPMACDNKIYRYKRKVHVLAKTITSSSGFTGVSRCDNESNISGPHTTRSTKLDQNI